MQKLTIKQKDVVLSSVHLTFYNCLKQNF
uniref:Uncharacterized protein n=1 Tax=Anguilla anguilla TaxID=7936 RepID=A0A0E9T4H5_ANGAN